MAASNQACAMSVTARISSERCDWPRRFATVATRSFSNARIPTESCAYRELRFRFEHGANLSEEVAVITLLA